MDLLSVVPGCEKTTDQNKDIPVVQDDSAAENWYKTDKVSTQYRTRIVDITDKNEYLEL